ncbi:MAG: hypothetical protein ACYSRQ_07470 [Planctomycetota bacterium]|jgi:hypothetical protein
MQWLILILILVIILVTVLKLLVPHKKNVEHKVVLPPKTSVGPDSKLKDFPLLYLYFDDFADISLAWQHKLFEAARDNTDIRSKKFSLNEILTNKDLFIDLYKNNLLRLRLNQRIDIWYEIGQLYWEDVIHPEKYSQETYSGEQMAKKEVEQDESIKAIVDKIKIRYGLDKTNNISESADPVQRENIGDIDTNVEST